MAPISAYAVATAQSVQVRSHDEREVLVEAGGFTPMRWFLERGAHVEVGKDDATKNGPPSKRRKISSARRPKASLEQTGAAQE